jgi:ABC-type sugar transport system ATPase subunit
LLLKFRIDRFKIPNPFRQGAHHVQLAGQFRHAALKPAKDLMLKIVLPGVGLLSRRVALLGKIPADSLTQRPLPADVTFDDRRISAGIRPEDLKYDDTDAAMLHGTVRTVEYLGSRSLVRVDVGDFLVSAFLTPSVELTAGSAIGLSPVEPSKVRFFDTQNGLALRGRATSKARK